MSSYNRYQEILDTAMLALEAVGNLDPPADDAPAPVRQTFIENLYQIHQVVGQATDLLIGISTTVGRDIDLEKAAGPWSAVEIRGNLAIPSQSSQEDPGFPSDPILLQHLDEIFDITSSVGLEEFASVVIGGYQGTLLEQEKTALRYALSGYNSFTKHELRGVFHFYERRSNSSDTANRAVALKDIINPHERLLARESLLFSGPDSNAVACYILKVVWNIESIEAVNAWDSFSKEEKNQFRSRMAPIADPAAFEEIDRDDNLSDKEKDDAKAFLVKKFTNRHNKIMQRRRYYWDLYENCGPSVLLDCYLLGLTQSEYPIASKFLDKLLIGVLTRIGGVGWGRLRYWKDRNTLLRIVRFFGGYHMFSYVDAFLDDNIPWFDVEAEVEGDSDSDWGHESE